MVRRRRLSAFAARRDRFIDGELRNVSVFLAVDGRQGWGSLPAVPASNARLAGVVGFASDMADGY